MQIKKVMINHVTTKEYWQPMHTFSQSYIVSEVVVQDQSSTHRNSYKNGKARYSRKPK